MSFEQKNKYTLYIKIDENISNDIKNSYLELENTCINNEDSGVDLYVPHDININDSNDIITVDHMISCCMYHTNTTITTGYYLYPRSSIYKFPVMMNNSVGIIDAGYRGNIKGMLRTFNNNMVSPNIIIPSNTRLFQICTPDLSPLKVKIIKQNETLPTSIRGNNGFGSTGN
jgi:dUTP pyrophosphatase